VLTVKSLVDEEGLELAAGERAADAPVRWVHITELLDPTPWLSGGELLLTTGMQLRTPAEQRQFVRRLADHHLSGLGLGTGFNHERLPRALLGEARKLDFPLFEVPYEMPFIAITEKAFAKLVNEQYEALQRGIATHKRLEQLVIEERGLEELTRALAGAVGGSVIVLDPRGRVMASSSNRRVLTPEVIASVRAEVAARTAAGKPDAFAPAHQAVSGRALALPVAASPADGPQAWLVAVCDESGPADFERLILQQAVTVVALELMRRRVVRDTERRLGGNLLAETLAGALEADDLALRLRPFGVRGIAAVLVFELDDPAAAEPALDRLMSERGVGALVATRERLLCAIVDAGEQDPVELAGVARERLSKRWDEIRAAASRPAPLTRLRRGFHEARWALEATALADGNAPAVASHRDLGAFQLLLSLQDDEALALYCDSVLGPIEQGEGEYGEELLRSLEAFLEENGQWERASRRLFCHRHTLRYRIRRIEELTGRDLSRAQDRIEFWLAMRGRELVGSGMRP
jgi:purine catabolism regulatory family protein/PucR-like helix-turn-helix protein/diguanylate cyclase with GGDEF domain